MKKGVWAVVFILIVTNCLTLGLWLSSKQEELAIPVSVETAGTSKGEVIAKVGEQEVTHQEWLTELERLYGEETLKELINRKVIYQLADKYNIEVQDEEIEQELTMIKAMYNSSDHEKFTNLEEWKEQIKYNLLLESILTKDVTIPEEQVKEFYQENQALYHIPTTYHMSHILVKTKEEAETVLEELNGGSDYAALAMEKSIDEFTSTQGGDLGFVTKESGYLPKEYDEVLSKLRVGEMTGPVSVDGKYAVIYLQEIVEGREFSYDDIKDHIHRQLALGQSEGNVSAEDFWQEIGVQWFYGKLNN